MNDGRSELASRIASGAVLRASQIASRCRIERMIVSPENQKRKFTTESTENTEKTEENIVEWPFYFGSHSLPSILLCALCVLCGDFSSSPNPRPHPLALFLFDRRRRTPLAQPCQEVGVEPRYQ